uniref:B3 domain-containing transcription factor VRN1 n=1 Tax=Cajanus cajan TaxID=3821 RepID=A0A151RGW3_CAJCA|nr:B3 domain-containing transcription factor VRN1 [Cajanus cajan]
MLNPVILSLPNGAKKKVYWLRHDGDVWFCNGWKEFATYSRLEASHFVVFRYEGNSSFNVIIFGKSAVEVEYPLSSDSNEEVEETHGTDKNVEERSSHKGKRKKSPSPLSRTSKKIQISPKIEVEEEDQLNHWKKKAGLDNSKYIHNGSFKRSIRNFHEKVKTMFHSENEHFTCAIQKTYIERDLLILPMEFSKHYLHKDGATLFIEDGRTWDVELKVNYCGQLTFSIGWKKFSQDNELKVGDVCGFELHKYKGFSFKVTVFRFEEDSSTPLFIGIIYLLTIISNYELLHRNNFSYNIFTKDHITFICQILNEFLLFPLYMFIYIFPHNFHLF